MRVSRVCFSVFIASTIIFSVSSIIYSHKEREAARQLDIEKHGACMVINGNPNVMQVVEIWPCNKAEAAVDENFKILERLGE